MIPSTSRHKYIVRNEGQTSIETGNQGILFEGDVTVQGDAFFQGPASGSISAKRRKRRKEVRASQRTDSLRLPGISDLISALKPVWDAEWDSGGSVTSGCLKGTRLDVMKSIWDWYLGGNSSPPIYWLKGDSGAGKSAIAYTSCQAFANKMLLGASFFFSRDQESRSKIDLVFITLAYRLSFSFPQLRKPIADALKDDTVISGPSLRRQLRELILLPIHRKVKYLKSPILIVIDALDECDGSHGENAIVEFIDILASELEALDDVPQVKFLVTSRPHEHLLRVFTRVRVQDRTNTLYLRDIDPSVQERDLRLFITAKLRDLAAEYRVSGAMDDWPSNDDISYLFHLSGGLFISAATLLRMMEVGSQDSYIDPRVFLAQLRHSESKTFGLDGIYREVLRMAARCHTTFKAREDLIDLLAFIVLSPDRLAAPDINALLGIQSEQFLPVLRSVISVPADGGPLRSLHASFHDFMTDAGRCVGTPIPYINTSLYHLKLAKMCLLKLRMLKRDLLNLRELQGIPVTDIMNADMQDRILSIPKELCYAVKHWPVHVAGCAADGSIKDEELLTLLEVFAKTGIIYWAEALSYLGYLSQGMADLESVMIALQHDWSDFEREIQIAIDASRGQWSADGHDSEMDGPSVAMPAREQLFSSNPSTLTNWFDRCSTLKSIFYDIRRLVLEHHDVISRSAMHLYYSALLFAPTDTGVYRLYTDSHGASSVHISGGVKSQWDACLQTVDLKEAVYSIAISPDGAHVVVGLRGVIVMIDVAAGGHQYRLCGHVGLVDSLTFSPDGTRIASGSGDNRVLVWDSRSHKRILKLEQHTDGIKTVAFSSDGSLIVSGSLDRTVRVWDSMSGKQLSELQGHTHSVNTAAFSPDGMRVVSGSKDKTIRIWDIGTSTQIWELLGHTSSVQSVAFAPEGTRIVSKSSDYTIRVWDTMSGTDIVITECDGSVESVTFSPDGTCIVSRASDCSVQVWDSVSGRRLVNSERQARWFSSVAFSPCNRRVASGSLDGTVRIWESRLGRDMVKSEPGGHTSAVNSLAFSFDGTWIASGSWDKTVRVWDRRSGRQVLELRGHTDWVNWVDFSLDATRLISGSDDKTVRIWDRRSGTQIFKLIGHTKATALSPSASVIAVTNNLTNAAHWQLWDIVSGKQVLDLINHTKLVVTSLAFSPDGARIVFGSYDGTVRVCDSRTGRQILEMQAYTNSTFSVLFSPDGSRILAASAWGSKIWDYTSGSEVMELKFGLETTPKSVRFSQDGRHILSENPSEGTLMIWDATTGDRLRAVDGSGPAVTPSCAQLAAPIWHVDHFNKRIVQVYPNGFQATICFLPPSYDIRSSRFHGAVGVLGLVTGQVVILHMLNSI